MRASRPSTILRPRPVRSYGSKRRQVSDSHPVQSAPGSPGAERDGPQHETGCVRSPETERLRDHGKDQEQTSVVGLGGGVDLTSAQRTGSPRELLEGGRETTDPSPTASRGQVWIIQSDTGASRGVSGDALRLTLQRIARTVAVGSSQHFAELLPAENASERAMRRCSKGHSWPTCGRNPRDNPRSRRRHWSSAINFVLDRPFNLTS